ncbi:MAG: sigma-54 dependent transcriptional regulator [Nitrospinota bacterium]|nr:sigma-54 dependent transcriptional regulator [Nitrospinota bacterium]
MCTEPKILIVDDEEKIRWVLKKALEKKRFSVHTAESAEQALEKIRTHRYLIVFSDIFMEGMSGLELLEKAREIDPALKIAVMTAQDTMNNTIEAMRMGAYDYISKPFDLEEVYALVAKVQASRKVEAPSGDTGEPETKNFSVQAIIGKNKKIQEVFKTIGKSAASDLAVLITGESGTGKEMVAGALHNYSRREGNPFICINCAAISRELLESELFGHEKGAFTGAVEQKKGKFELAHGGTIFLDEIGDMELPLQSKILRVLQNNEFYHVGGKTPIQSDVRIIAATNQNLEEMMEQKRFRKDLYHRLNVIPINLSPLRERPEDVLLLANHFIKRYSPDLTRGEVYLSPEVEQFFRNYQWPGNIRELENAIKRSLVLASSGPILKEHLSLHLLPASLEENELNKKLEERICLLIRDILSRNDFKDGVIYEEVIQKIEKPLFEILLEKHSGKQIAAARELGINRNTLKRKMDAMNIQVKKRRSNPEP